MSQSPDLDEFFVQKERLQLPDIGISGVSRSWVTDDGELFSVKPDQHSFQEVYCYREKKKLLGWVIYYLSLPYRGNISMATHPNHRGEGICHAILYEVTKNHKIEVDRQDYSEAGRRTMERVVRAGVVDTEQRQEVPWAEYYDGILTQMDSVEGTA